MPNPRLAIIIDDLGYDRSAADAVLALTFLSPFPCLPHLPLSAELAEEAQRRGDQVMLHLPMQSAAEDAKPEDIELRVGMAPRRWMRCCGNARIRSLRRWREQPPRLARHLQSRVDAGADARAAATRPLLHR